MLLESIFASIVASCIYGGTAKLIELIQANKSFDKQLKDAFARAVHKYFKDELQRDKVIYHDADKYILRFKQELNGEANIASSEKYQGLYKYFEREIFTTPSLWSPCVYFQLKTGRKLMLQYKDEIIGVIDSKSNEIIERVQGIEEQLSQFVNFATLPVFSVNSNLDHVRNDLLLPEHISMRANLVKQLSANFEHIKVLLIHGATQCGKSTLAKLIALHITPKNKSCVIDCSNAPSFQYIKFTLQQRMELDASTCVVIDNLAKEYVSRVLDLLSGASYKERFIITTPEEYLDKLSTSSSKSVLLQYEVPELTDIEVSEIIHTYHPIGDIAPIVALCACHHPRLVQYVCLYLQSNNWKYDESTIKQLLNGAHLKSYESYISELLMTTTPDPETIHLLNRILLFQSFFNEKDVENIANVRPEISQPRMRFQQIKPNWLITIGNQYQVTPLLKKMWHPDLLHSEIVDCNKYLGDAIIQKHNISDVEAIQAIMYYQNAGMYDYAGEIYVKMIFSTPHIPKHSLVNILWMGVSLPIQMRAELRFIIRAGQILRFKDLNDENAEYLYKDIQTVVEQECTTSHMAPIIYRLMSSICFVKDDIENGLRFYRMSESLWSEEVSTDTNLPEYLNEYLQSNIWTLLMRITTWDQLNEWLHLFQETHSNRYQLSMLEYTSCYFFVWRFVDIYNSCSTIEERLEVIEQLYDIVESYHIDELSIMIRFKEIDLFNNYKQYDKVYEKGKSYLQEYSSHPLANLVFNAAIGYAYYRDTRHSDQIDSCLRHLNNSFKPDGVDILPDVQLHVMELQSYALSSSNAHDALVSMQNAYEYVKDSRHRIEPYDYYFAKAELSLAKWLAGERYGALEDISDCLEYVLNDLNNESFFAKTYLCKCGCLLVKYEHDIQNKPLPQEQASPFPGMFTEPDAQGLDDLYEERRNFTTATIMFLLSVEINNAVLINKWMYKCIAMCVEAKELKAEYGVCLTMLPYLLKNEDIDEYVEVADLSYHADQLIPNHNSENDDIGFIVLKVLPLVILAIQKIIVENDYSLYQSLSRRIHSFEIGKNSVAVQRVAQILSTPIAEVDHNLLEGIDANSHYEVYMTVYLIMLLKEDSTKKSFTICFFLLKFAQPHCRKIYKSSLDWLFDDFMCNLWHWKYANRCNDFEDVTKLLNEGFNVINDTKIDKAKKCLYVLSFHIKGLSLTPEQEDWLYD